MNRPALSRIVAALAAVALAVGLSPTLRSQEVVDAPDAGAERAAEPANLGKVRKTEAQWRKLLTRDQFYVLRQKGTEAAFSGRYATGHPKGTFVCAGCATPLFSSRHKFDSGTGWPSFYRPVDPKLIATEWDHHLAEPRVEVMCARCDGHLGHVFNDGPPPTGLRYCINSAALVLKPFEPNAAKAQDKDKAKAQDKAKPKDAGAAEPAPAEAATGDAGVVKAGTGDDAAEAAPAPAPAPARARNRTRGSLSSRRAPARSTDKTASNSGASQR